MRKLKLSHTEAALTVPVMAAKPTTDPRSDHLKMLIEADARQWRVLGYVEGQIGKTGIAKIEGCHRSRVQTSYKRLRDKGLIEHQVPGKEWTPFVLTKAGIVKMAELRKGEK